MSSPTVKRCAVYTRKSSEEGLEQDFNSLHAQREACEAFIKSQQSEGWRLISHQYNDGGISGGTMERPALRQLLADISAGKIDVVVVYKVDRLTRSLADFAKMVEVFDAKGASFVAVTQQFNTTTSMGRLTLNVLLSFAQFEREVTGERIRDKIAASKKKGMWMGGLVPFGYEAKDRKLVIRPAEAELVRKIFQRYLVLGNVRLLKKELHDQRIVRRHRSGSSIGFSKSGVYTVLRNSIYAGQVSHGKVTYPGLHERIIDQALWDSVQKKLIEQAARARDKPGRKSEPLALIGKVFDESGEALAPSSTLKAGRRYRYYCSRALLDGSGGCTKNQQTWRLPAQELEQAIAAATKKALEDHRLLTAALSKHDGQSINPRDLFALAKRDAERISEVGLSALRLVLERVDLRADGIQLKIRLPTKGADFMFTHFVPTKMKRRGVELKVITGERATKADPTLLKAIGRALKWFEAMKAGKLLPDIAAEEEITTAYVRRILQLAFLAPQILEAVTNGAQPVELTTQRLVYDTKLDAYWDRQRQQLGFSRWGPPGFPPLTVGDDRPFKPSA